MNTSIRPRTWETLFVDQCLRRNHVVGGARHCLEEPGSLLAADFQYTTYVENFYIRYVVVF